MNPFTPAFGRIPPILAGRSMLISELEHALTSNGSDPNLCSLFIGPHGVGKTVLLSHMVTKAETLKWIAANVTARPGMLEDIIERSTEAADAFVKKKDDARTSVTIGGLFGASWEYRNPQSGNWRTRMNNVLDRLVEHDIGLLITVDEVDPTLDELVDFASTYQHFVRENRKVALFMAGLPTHVSTLLSDRSVSFLRRAAQHTLGRIDDAEIQDTFTATVAEAGKTIDAGASSQAAHEIDGFAYMMQLVGYRTWEAPGDEKRITLQHVETGARTAQRDFENGVLKKTCQELSDGDMAFLL